MIVLDASVVVDLLLGVSPAAGTIERRMLEDGASCAPQLLDAEVGQVLRRFVLRGDLSVRRAREALDDLLDLPLTRHPHAPLVERAFDLHRNVSFYDALYLSLAEALDAPLLTRDRALATVPGVQVSVQVL